MDRRRESKNNSRQQRDAERPQQHRHVQTNTLQADEIAWTDRDQRLDSEPGETQTEYTPEQRQQQALVQQLSRDAHAPRSERRPQRDLLFTRRRLRQEQVRDIRARDQQHESNRAQHQPERPPHVAEKLFAERQHFRRVVLVVLRNLVRQTRLDGL